QNGRENRWLATKWAWTSGNKTLTFTIRNGVKFSNGTPLTAADVAFTFNLMKQFKPLDINQVWSVLSSVTAQGSDQVVMQFKTEAVQDFYFIADQVGIVSQKIWSKVSNPVTYADKSPVGTGAFTMSKCPPPNLPS